MCKQYRNHGSGPEDTPVRVVFGAMLRSRARAFGRGAADAMVRMRRIVSSRARARAGVDAREAVVMMARIRML